MEDIFNEVKSLVSIQDVISRYSNLQFNRNNQTCCPFHKEKSPSFTIYPETNSFHCFGCGESGDAITFVQKIKNLQPIEAAQTLIDDFKLNIRPDNLKLQKREEANKIKSYIEKCEKDLYKTDYLRKRHITDETAKRFHCGYDVEKNAVVFPYTSKLNYFQRRTVKYKSFYKPSTDIVGAEPIFNENILKDNSVDPVFVVESPICAMSIAQYGGKAIALGGKNGGTKLIEYAKKNKIIIPLLLCFDEDGNEDTIKAQQNLEDELEKLKIVCIPYKFSEDCKDPNELLMKDERRFIKSVKLGISKGNKFTIKGKEFTLAELEKRELPEIYFCVDEILPQGLSVMAAPPKAGKSFFALQLAIAIAKGKPFLNHKTNKSYVCYYALEDNEQRIQKRTSVMLKNEPGWPNNLKICLYANSIDNGLMDDLKSKVRKNRDLKLIIIDTLQKVRGKANKNETAYTTDYNELGKLKEFADKHDIALLLIHHFRKQKDVDDVFNQFSGSNGINGACDNMFAFQQNKDLPTEFKCKGRDICFDPISIELDKDLGLWKTLGSAEEQKQSLIRKAYENNDLVKIAKHLAKTNWTGTATDFLEKGCQLLGYCPAEVSSRKLKEKLTEISNQLKNYDNIIYIGPSKTMRIHKLFYINNHNEQLKTNF